MTDATIATAAATAICKSVTQAWLDDWLVAAASRYAVFDIAVDGFTFRSIANRQEGGLTDLQAQLSVWASSADATPPRMHDVV
jgi:hypothetical protein